MVRRGKIVLQLCAIVSLTGISAYAGEAGSKVLLKAQPFHVDQLDPSFDVDRMKMPGVRIRHSDEGENQTSPLPPAGIRNQLAERAGIAEDISGWDAFGRDMLFINAVNLAPDRLAAEYPKLDAGKLKEFQRLVREFRKAKP